MRKQGEYEQNEARQGRGKQLGSGQVGKIENIFQFFHPNNPLGRTTMMMK